MLVDHPGDPPVPGGEVADQPELVLTAGHDAGGGSGVGTAAEVGLLRRIRDHVEGSPKGADHACVGIRRGPSRTDLREVGGGGMFFQHPVGLGCVAA